MYGCLLLGFQTLHALDSQNMYLKIMIVMKLPMTPISPHTKVKTPSPQKSTFLIKVEFEFKVEWQSSSDELLLFSPSKLMVDWIIVTSFTVVYWLSVSDIYNKAINISYSTNVKANLRLYKDIRYTLGFQAGLSCPRIWFC